MLKSWRVFRAARATLVAAFLVVPLVGAQAAPKTELKPAQIARMDAVIAPVRKPDSPGCAIGVMRSGSLVYQRYFGLADLERHVPITPQTRFYIASSSKPFTAMA